MNISTNKNKYRILRRSNDRKTDSLVLLAPFKPDEFIDHRPESWIFSFHRIIEEEANQQDVFENIGRPVIDSVLNGYNGTVFAYGQTGSGKTYTITGQISSNKCQGIVPRSLSYLFDFIKMHPENIYSVDVAYLEIYNEYGYDLLDRKQQQQQQQQQQVQVQQAMRLEDLPTQLLSEALIQIVLTISLYRLFLLLTDVGRRKNDKTAPLLLRTGPCCCWPCLPFPKLDMNDSRLAVIRLIVLQLPIVQGLLFFIMLVVALDEQKIEPSYLIWFQPFTLISILIGIYGLTITNKSLNVVAPEAKLRLKTLVTQLALVFSKLQAIIIKLLVYTGIFPCSPPLPPRVFANVTQSGLLIIEMLLLCIAARHLYYVDLEKEEDSSLKDRSNDKPHGLTNKNDLPEQLSNKIAVVTIS